jgi:hypothetical protein
MFQINTRPDTYQTGITSDGRRLIVGPVRFPLVLAVFFDEEGALLSVEHRVVPAEGSSDDYVDDTDRENINRVLSKWKAELGFIEQPIRVEKFFLRDHKIGTEVLPLDLADYLSNPSEYSEEDQREFIKDIDKWKREGNCVFYWGEGYHLDRDGEPH